MTHPEVVEDGVVQAVYDYAAEQMSSGASEQEIQSMLVEQGLDQQTAAAVVSDLARARPQAIRDAAEKNMVQGGLWFIGGLLVTGYTYLSSSGGGTYIVAWGAILFGALQFFNGLTAKGPPVGR